MSASPSTGTRRGIERLRQDAGLLARFRKPWQHEELLAFVEQALAEG